MTRRPLQDLDALLRGNGSAIYQSGLIPATTPADEEGSTAYANPAVECSDAAPYPEDLTDDAITQLVAEENAYQVKHVSRHFAAAGVTFCPRWGKMREAERVRPPSAQSALPLLIQLRTSHSTPARGIRRWLTQCSSSVTKPIRSPLASTPSSHIRFSPTQPSFTMTASVIARRPSLRCVYSGRAFARHWLTLLFATCSFAPPSLSATTLSMASCPRMASNVSRTASSSLSSSFMKPATLLPTTCCARLAPANATCSKR